MLRLFYSRPRHLQSDRVQHVIIRIRSHEQKVAARPLSGRFGNDDSPNPQTTAFAWLCSRTAHQTNFAGLASDRRRIVVSRVAADSQGRVSESGLGHLLNQSPSADLQVDPSGSNAFGA